MLFIEMPLIEGTDLRHVLDAQDGPLPVERVVGLVEQVAGALDAAHEVGLTHRDVKPENVLVTPDDFCYLADFGIAKRADDTRLTERESVVGSLRYLAPERLRDQPAAPAADIYALACVAYELVVGQPAVAATTPEAITQAQLHDYPPVPPDTVPPPIVQALRQGLDKDPTARPATAGDFARALRAGVPVPVLRQRFSRLQWGAAVLMVLALVSAGTAIGAQLLGESKAAPQALVLMPADRTTPDTFTDTTVTQRPSDTAAAPYARRASASKSGTATGTTTATSSAPSSAAPPVVTTTVAAPSPVPGNTANLYGVLDSARPACDTAALVRMITKDRTRAQVWAGLLDTTVERIGPTVAAMTSVLLRDDTLVTNSDYRDGKAITYPAVLQAGTAVLVDRFGVPRVKCNCGNPLAEVPADGVPETVSGQPWPQWNGRATRVSAARSPIVKFAVTQIGTGRTTSLARGSRLAAAPTGPTDGIRRFDFGNAFWGVEGAEIQLRGGKLEEGGRTAWELVRKGQNGRPPIAGDQDLDGDGYLDSIQGIVRNDGPGSPLLISYYVWLWDPQRRTARQLGIPLSQEGKCDDEQVLSITVQDRRISVNLGLKSGNECANPPSGSRTDTYVIRGDRLVKAAGPATPSSAAPAPNAAPGVAPTSRQLAAKLGCSNVDGNDEAAQLFSARDGVTCDLNGVRIVINTAGTPQQLQTFLTAARQLSENTVFIATGPTWMAQRSTPDRNTGEAEARAIQAKLGGSVVSGRYGS